MFATANLPAKKGKAHLINTSGCETQHIWGAGERRANDKTSARTCFPQKTGSLTAVLSVKTALSAAQEICSQKFHSKSGCAVGKKTDGSLPLLRLHLSAQRMGHKSLPTAPTASCSLPFSLPGRYHTLLQPLSPLPKLQQGVSSPHQLGGRTLERSGTDHPVTLPLWFV